jgi:phosphatidylserine/phosphatidylglycerophosphate/cardiolipin synthase-like enzyme
MNPAWIRRIRIAAILATLGLPLSSPGFDPSHTVSATGTIEYAFTPGDDAAAVIIRAIDEARAQVLVQAFSFTHRDIADALIRAKRRGLDVQVIADRDQIELLENSAVPGLAVAGVPVFTDSEHGAAHNKVMVIDTDAGVPVLILGSFNFTFAAQFRNAENVLALRGNNELNRAYRADWKRHRIHSSTLGPAVLR